MENATKHPLYCVWAGMKERCLNPKGRSWKNYGGRGITVCDRWRNSFDNFVADMPPRPPGMILDREDNNGNYEPGNCRWVDSMTSGFNVRSIRMLTINGRTQHVAAWSRESGINSATILARFKAGLPHDKILSKNRLYTSRLGKKGGGRPSRETVTARNAKLKAVLEGL